jgi:monoamine oxidase
LHGATAIVTVPLNTLAGIEFAPALSEAKLAAAAEGQASHGWKAWVQLKGDFEGTLVGIASEDHIVNWIHTEAVLPDGQVLVAFGYDGAQLDLVDRDAVQEAIGELLPDAEVVAVEGHDWLGDEFSRGTWPVLRPGQHTGYLPVLQAPEGRLIFAGSETANGWNGFIDGAIESGLRAAREARQVLRATTPALHATH